MSYSRKLFATIRTHQTEISSTGFDDVETVCNDEESLGSRAEIIEMEQYGHHQDP